MGRFVSDMTKARVNLNATCWTRAGQPTGSFILYSHEPYPEYAQRPLIDELRSAAPAVVKDEELEKIEPFPPLFGFLQSVSPTSGMHDLQGRHHSDACAHSEVQRVRYPTPG